MPCRLRLLDVSIDADFAGDRNLRSRRCARPSAKPKGQPRRVALPKDLPRHDILHEPDNMQCGCGCALERIGEDVSEKLDYLPGVFQVERHVRGKWGVPRM